MNGREKSINNMYTITAFKEKTIADQIKNGTRKLDHVTTHKFECVVNIL